jgi:hypothetical protein
MGLVAIATSDGKTIDGRLDTPGTFYIYYFDDNRAFTLVEQRSIPQHPGCQHQSRLPQSAALLLADVQLVLVTCVPRQTEIFLLTRGIMAIAVRGPVYDALESYQRRGWLLEELLTKLRRRFRKSLNSTELEHGE